MEQPVIVYQNREDSGGGGDGLETPPDGFELNSKINDKKFTKLVTLAGHPESQISLKCDLDEASSRGSLLGHKVTWYLNGQFIHSNPPAESFNFTMKSLPKLLDPSIASHHHPEAILGPISCAHHVLTARDPKESNEFKGSQMKVYQSKQDLKLRFMVEPRLFTERRDLIPSMRSFSKLELEANSASKLKLTCLMQCEPLCSPEWSFGYLETGYFINDSLKPELRPLLTNAKLENKYSYQTIDNSTVLFLRKTSFADNLNPSVVSLENLIHKPNGSAFNWISLSSNRLTSSSSSIGGQISSESLSQQLVRELAEVTAGSGGQPVGPANVVSRLELTYNQISQLLTHHQTTVYHPPQTSSLNRELVFQCSQTSRRADMSYFRLLPNRWLSLSDDNLESRQALVPAANRELDSKAGSMSIRILLDKPPHRVAISFGNSQPAPENQVLSLSESQLLEVLSIQPQMELDKKPNSLKCLVGPPEPFPRPQFKWSFTDLNGTLHQLPGSLEEAAGKQELETIADSELNLRHFVEWFRQRQQQQQQQAIQSTTGTANKLDLVTSLMGNFTCEASNLHGSKSGSLSFEIQGRPLCKLTLQGQMLSQDNELMAILRCSVYSKPQINELIWIRNGQQVLALNRADINGTNWTNFATTPSIGSFGFSDFQVMVLDKQQSFMLTDLSNSDESSFKCLAKNSLGFSETCELTSIDRQILLNIAKPMDSIAGAGLSMPAHINRQQLLNHSSIGFVDSSSASEPVISLFRILTTRFDWLLALICSILLIWILFSLANTLANNRRVNKYNPQRKLATLSKHPKHLNKDNLNVGWRFNLNNQSSEDNNSTLDPKRSFLMGSPSGTIVQQVPFHKPGSQSTKLYESGPANFYGLSTNNNLPLLTTNCSSNEHTSELDIIMNSSSSTTNQYDDFALQQHQLTANNINFDRFNRQPIYAQGNYGYQQHQQHHGTLGSNMRDRARQGAQQRGVANSSLSGSSSTGDSSLGSGPQQQAHNVSTSARPHTRDFVAGSMPANHQTTLPIVNGAHNSRINLDHQQQQRFNATNQQYRQAAPGQQSFVGGGNRTNNANAIVSSTPANNTSEPIYDDVIYNQMIL